MSEKMQGLSFRGTILPALVAGLGLLASGCGSSEAVNSESKESVVPGDDLKATVYQGIRRVTVKGSNYSIECAGDTAVFYSYSSAANMSDKASKWICQGLGGVLPSSEDLTIFVQTGHIPDQPQG